MKSLGHWVVIAGGLLLMLLHLQAQSAAEPDGRQCALAKTFHIPGVSLEMTGTEWIQPQQSTVAGALPAYCRVEGMLNRRLGVEGKEYGIGFALALPANWNHDFLMQGGGALNGSIQPPLGGQAAGSTTGLSRGFAVVSTNTGHKGTSAFDASFMKDQQAVLDFDYQAIGRMAEVAKQIIAQYYGAPAAYSYFSGCSTGGREAMIMTQRYPSYFDGVISGDPAMRTGFSNLADRWAAVSYNRIAAKDDSGKPLPGTALSEQDEKLIVNALLKRCDAKDGVQDGMVFNVDACDFDPAALTCAGSKTDSCLSSQQVNAVKRAFSGPKDSRGFQVYPGFPYDAGINAKKGIRGLLSPGPSPVGPLSPMTQDVEAEAVLAQQPLVDSVATNLSTFSGHGGRLLFYHGVSDPWFSPLDTLQYYRKMTADNGGAEEVLRWSRFYFVPGMGHCGGGESALDRFDMLGAAVNWVEKGIPPDSVIATGKAFPGRSRPLCFYPRHAEYSGHGDTEDARNFECR